MNPNLLTDISPADPSLNYVWGMPTWLCWIIIAILLIVSGIYSASENAYTNCNKYHFMSAANKGSFTAKLILRLINKFDNTLITVLVGNNIVQTFMSFLSAMLFYNLCIQLELGSGVEAILSTVVMAALVYIVADTCPKILSKAIPNRMAYILCYPVTITNIILYPVIMIFKGILALVHKIFKIKEDSLLSKEDLIHNASLAVNDEEEIEEGETEEKLFENDEKEILSNVFSFDKKKVKSVYTPFEKVFYFELEGLTAQKINEQLLETHFSRIPILDKENNEIEGILVLKTYFEEYFKDEHLDIRSILEQPVFCKEDDNIDDVLDSLKKEKLHMAIVKDDAKILGIITMEDILEELVDDIDEAPLKNEINSEVTSNG